MKALKGILGQLAGLGIYTAVQSGVKLVGNYIIGKLAAIYLGTAGFALLGQFQNIVVLFQNLSNGAIQSGLIKHVSEHRDSALWKSLIRTSFSVSVVSALTLAVGLMLGYERLNDMFLGLEEPFIPFLCLALSLFFFSLNLFLVATFSGLQDYRSLAIFHVIQTLCMVGLFAVLLIYQGLTGAMIAVSVYSVVAFLIALIFFRKSYRQVLSSFRFQFDPAIIRSLSSYALMGLFTIAAASLSLLWLRTYVINNISVDVGGLWEGLSRISNFYIYFLAVIFSSYILPRYATESSIAALRAKVSEHLKVIFPLVTVILLGVWLLGKPLVIFIFSEEFLPLLDALPYHLTGDGFKVLAWVFSNLLVARKQTKLFILNESVYFVSLIMISMLIGTDLIGMAQAYAISGALYLLISAFIVNRTLRLAHD